MAALKPSHDPYRVLGILRGADQAQIKAAHRRLAKRFHPDGSTGDEGRFLAVQEAYQLLSDPVRRREWDRQHAPGPVRPGGPVPPGQASRQGARRPRPQPTTVRRGTPREARPYRPPGQRRTTWSAEHVPWWSEFDRRRRGDAAGPSAADPEAPAERAASAAGRDRPAPPSMDFDVFDRSSGAAWSAAARRHFRRDTDDLPSRGVWRFRGTQVVTGAEARKVAEEEERKKGSR